MESISSVVSVKSEKTRDFRVSGADKLRAYQHYRRISSNYEHVAGMGLLRYLRERERSAVLQLADLRPGLRLIDVGCGAGYYALRAKALGLTVTVADIVPHFTQTLRPFVDEVIHADVEALRLSEEFDRVICAGVLDFVVNPEAALLNLCSLVAPAGKLTLLLPREGLGGMLYRLEKGMKRINVNLFSKDWIQEVASKAGLFLIGCIYPLPNSMAVVFQRVGPGVGKAPGKVG